MERKEKNEILLRIGDRIEARRLEKGLSKTEFAQLIGTSRPQLERIITGNVNSTIVRLKEICDAAEMSLTNLVS